MSTRRSGLSEHPPEHGWSVSRQEWFNHEAAAASREYNDRVTAMKGADPELARALSITNRDEWTASSLALWCHSLIERRLKAYADRLLDDGDSFYEVLLQFDAESARLVSEVRTTKWNFDAPALGFDEFEYRRFFDSGLADMISAIRTDLEALLSREPGSVQPQVRSRRGRPPMEDRNAQIESVIISMSAWETKLGEVAESLDAQGVPPPRDHASWIAYWGGQDPRHFKKYIKERIKTRVVELGRAVASTA